MFHKLMAIMLTSIMLVTQVPLYAWAEPLAIDAPKQAVGSLVLPDNPPQPPIGSDPSRYKEDVDLLYDLMGDGGVAHGHTGFMGKTWEWSTTPIEQEDGTLTHWVEHNSHHTDNGHIEKQDYRASDFTADELGVSEEIYSKLVAENTPIDIEIDSREDTMQNYRAYVVPTQAEVDAMLARGETPVAFLYYNNDVKLNFKFNYPPPPPKQPAPKPSGERQEVVYVAPSWGSGSVSWGMFKDTLKESGSSETKIRWVNGLAAGSHYAQTASAHKMSGVVSTSATTVDRVAGAKGSETYSLSYNYTDHRIDYYNCSRWDGEEDEDGNIVSWTCGSWALVGSAPDWSQTKTYSCSVALPVDHKYGETFEGEHGFEKEMNIGRSATVQAQSCSSTEDAPKTEKITHESAPVLLPTQTHMSFMEQPIQWTGTPMYNTADVFPFVANEEKQGVAGVPELDESFKKLNKYVEKTAEFENPYSIPLRNEVTGTKMNIFSKEDFWVSRSTGFVTSTLHDTTVHNAKVQAGYEFKTVTGQEYRDEILDRADLTSMYYLPIDANNNVMKPNTAYKMETQVNGLGYNNITIMHDQDFLFENYLIGSVFEEEGADVEGVWIVEQNEIPINDIMYTHSALVTPQEAATISAATKGRTNFIFGHKGTDNMAVYDQVKQALNYNKFGEALSTKIPHVIDVETAKQTLK